MHNYQSNYLKLLCVTVCSGFIVEVGGKISQFYYKYLSGRERCDTGFAPCFIGFFEQLFIFLAGVCIALLIIFYFLSTKKIKRNSLIFLMGTITMVTFNYICMLGDFWTPWTQLWLFPLTYSLHYVLFSGIFK